MSILIKILFFSKDTQVMLYTVHLGQDRGKENKYLSKTLLEKIKVSQEVGKKVLLYINKRGGYSSLVCQDCAYLFGCPHCDVSQSVHLTPPGLLCHLCGESQILPVSCHKCQGNNLIKVGVGIQQIENTLQKLFPTSRIFRFDSDSINTKTAKSGALESLHKADIIIGTKMLTTGFDFENVGVVGVILLEQELSYPQYNKEEKVYTSLRQLIGRGERRGQNPDIVIQTFIPQNPLIKIITESNYKSFFASVIQERKEFGYPPFCEMMTLDYRDLNKEKSMQFMLLLENKILSLEETQNSKIIRNMTPFKKNKFYHSTVSIKSQNIRPIIKYLEAEILRNPKLSLILE